MISSDNSNPAKALGQCDIDEFGEALNKMKGATSALVCLHSTIGEDGHPAYESEMLGQLCIQLQDATGTLEGMRGGVEIAGKLSKLMEAVVENRSE